MPGFGTYSYHVRDDLCNFDSGSELKPINRDSSASDTFAVVTAYIP